MNEQLIVSACVVGLVIGIGAIVVIIKRLQTMLKTSVECVLPIVSRQTIEFRSPGEKHLHISGPRFTTAFARVEYSLKDHATGLEVPLRIVLFRAHSSGLKRVKLLTHRCTIAHAGLYEFEISGIREGADLSSVNVIFTKPYRAKVVLFVLGLIFSGWLAIAGIVFGALAYTRHI